MKNVLISAVVGFVVGASLIYFTSKPLGNDYSQKMISELPDSTTVAEYNGGTITAKDVHERIKPLFEKTRSDLLQHYVRAAEEIFAERHKNRLEKEAEPVSEAELSLYMKSNKIGPERKTEIQNFLMEEKKRIQGQLGRMSLLKELNFRNKLGTAFFNIQNTSGMAERGSGGITVQVFCDFGNPLCNRARLTLEGLLNQYKDSVKWVYRHYPVASNKIGDQASLVSLCALEQKKFWPVHDAFYNNQNTLSAENLNSLAERAGVNMDDLKSCLQTERPAQLLKEEKNVAEQLGLNSTPAYFVNGMRITDPEKVAPTVQSLLQK